MTPQQEISKPLNSSTFAEITFTFGEITFTFGEITFTFAYSRRFAGFFLFCCWGGFGTLWVGGPRRGFRKYLTHGSYLHQFFRTVFFRIGVVRESFIGDHHPYTTTTKDFGSKKRFQRGGVQIVRTQENSKMYTTSARIVGFESLPSYK